ncbi:uncharacterized protein METZ01_LOCUS40548 [marine metagenome]|uniref:Uncharacterized protein n=1 Tax=marine metagenome TaxID=408172 RepID=A0A381R908_9ZZZZ
MLCSMEACHRRVAAKAGGRALGMLNELRLGSD